MQVERIYRVAKTKQRINICKAAYTEVSDDCATGKCTRKTMKKDKVQKRRKRISTFFQKGVDKQGNQWYNVQVL